MRAVYTGHEALTFTDYLDLDTGKTLHAQPGRVYDISPASGRAAAEVPAPWFTPLGEAWTPAGDWQPVALAEAAPEPEPAPEPQDDTEPGTEPEPPDGEGQSF